MDLQKVIEVLTELDTYFEKIAEKVCNMELRQSHASGDSNDAIRAVHAFATGGSVCMPDKACKTVCDLIMMGETATYWQEFLNKDIRRCEFELYKFFEAFCKKNVQAVVKTQYSLGEPVMMLPSTRARLVQYNNDVELMLPKLDEHLVELYKLTMPLDKCCMPTTVAELKHRKVLPEHSTYNTLAEEEAKAVFKKLKKKYPKLAEIEFIPLLPVENDQYENWHTKLLRQIRVWNVHTEKVVNANATIIRDKADKVEAAKSDGARAANAKIAQAYNCKSQEFWSKTDFNGEMAIKLANTIRKRWNDQAKDGLIEGEAAPKQARCSLTEGDASIKK
jgi:hypothetical protein